MESVEELCSHIALINLAKKILEGEVKKIRKEFRSQMYEVQFAGNNISLANALGSHLKLIDTHQDGEYITARVQSLQGHSPNELLNQLLPHVEIHAFREVLPTMNEVFIRAVNKKAS